MIFLLSLMYFLVGLIAGIYTVRNDLTNVTKPYDWDDYVGFGLTYLIMGVMWLPLVVLYLLGRVTAWAASKLNQTNT